MSTKYGPGMELGSERTAVDRAGISPRVGVYSQSMENATNKEGWWRVQQKELWEETFQSILKDIFIALVYNLKDVSYSSV